MHAPQMTEWECVPDVEVRAPQELPYMPQVEVRILCSCQAHLTNELHAGS